MKQLRTLGLLVVALAGLLAYLYFVDADKPVGDVEEKPTVFTVKAEDIEELKVSTIAGGEAALRKTADGWQLTSPEPARADESEVTGITSSLASIAVQRVVDENPSGLGDYGLADPVVEVSYRTKDAKEFQTLQIGTKTPTGSDMYAKTADSPRVFLVFGYLESSFNKTPFDLRDKKILAFDRDKADRIEIRRSGSVVTLVKADAAWRLAAPVDARGDYSVIEALLSRLHSAQMTAIVEKNAGDLRKYGLDAPVAEVTVSAGSAQATMAFGTKAEDGSVHVRDVSRGDVVTVAGDLLTDVERDASEYRRKDVFEFRSFTLDRLELTRDGATTVYERQKGKGKDGADLWRNATADKELDAAKFESFLSRLSGLRAESFVDAATQTGLDAPVLTVKAAFDESTKHETVAIGRAGGAVFASREGEPGAARLPATEFDEALKALDEFK